jgi:hypothetical protein
MARLPKKPKVKESRTHIYRVPLLALKVYATKEEAKAAADHCDRCDRQPREEEWDDPQWVLTLGVTEDGLLGIARLCPDCFPMLEWGDVYAPLCRTGSPAIPIGIANGPPNMIEGRPDDRKTA